MSVIEFVTEADYLPEKTNSAEYEESVLGFDEYQHFFEQVPVDDIVLDMVSMVLYTEGE